MAPFFMSYCSFYFLVYIYNNVWDVLLLQYDTKKCKLFGTFNYFFYFCIV